MLKRSPLLFLTYPNNRRYHLAADLTSRAVSSCTEPPIASSSSPSSSEFPADWLDETYESDAEGERRSKSGSFGSTRIGIVRLPNALVQGVQSVVHSIDNRSTIRTSALSLYSRYRLTSPKDSLEKTVDELRASAAEKSPADKSEGTVKAKLKTSYDHLSTISYAAGAMPSTYGATLRVLVETKRRLTSEQAASVTSPEWTPAVILDYGSGTGAAAWAAKEVWPEALTRYHGLEKSSSMIWLSNHLLNPPAHISQDQPWPFKLHTSFHRMTIAAPKSRKASEDPKAGQRLIEALNEADAEERTEIDLELSEGRSALDLDPKHMMAIMSFTLSDLPNADARRQAVSGIWNSGAETMVVIDRGTPAGFKVVADARQQLLMLGRRVIKNSQSVELQTDEVACEHQVPSSGSWVLAPCPHDQACPLHHSNNPKHFCHFSQRIERPKFLKDTKHSDKPEEDAKFSYVVIRRGRRPRTETDAQSPTSLIAEEHDGPDEQGWMKHAIDWPRIILPPHKRKGHVIMDVCASSGHIERMTIPRSQGKQDYYDARKSHWGDTWPHGSKKPGLVKDICKTRTQGKEETPLRNLAM